jgi:hypothetical protein
VNGDGEQRLQAWGRIALGVILAALAGLCTYNVAVNGSGNGLVYLVGGLPILAGAVIVGWGVRDLRRLSSRSDVESSDD